ncbi:MAG: tetratricopeptide repeat protein, partial [Mucilaginibacter sp.]|nr:tetratricopeptide repeat protein [Mucilaginibacter sp.]
QQPPNKVSKDDAQRMLDALNDQEKNTQNKLKNRKLKGEKVPVIKDW